MDTFAGMQDFTIGQVEQDDSNENIVNSFQGDSVDERAEDEEDLQFIHEVVSSYLKDL